MAVSAFVASAVVLSVTGTATAASAAVGVEFENDHGAEVTCNLPTAPSTVGATNTLLAQCQITGWAAGAAAGPTGSKNFCFEGASLNASSAAVRAGLFNCRVDVTATITATTTATRVSESQVVYTCAGGGAGVATYTPASGSVARSLTGPVVVEYGNGVFTVKGALASVENRSAGVISAVGHDSCSEPSTRAASPENFLGTIN